MSRKFLLLPAAVSFIAAMFFASPRVFAGSPVKGERYVVLVSMDGFRHDYIDSLHTPSFDKMAKVGVSAVMMPSYPASTFPNHYAIATGLVPDHNGLVNNSFWNPDANANGKRGPFACKELL